MFFKLKGSSEDLKGGICHCSASKTTCQISNISIILYKALLFEQNWNNSVFPVHICNTVVYRLSSGWQPTAAVLLSVP